MEHGSAATNEATGVVMKQKDVEQKDAVRRLPPSTVYWVDPKEFRRIGHFFVNVADPDSLFFNDDDYLMVLAQCSRHRRFRTPADIDRFHRLKCREYSEQQASADPRRGKQSRRKNQSARTKNKFRINVSKQFPVLLLNADGSVANFQTVYAKETNRWSKYKIDSFNRNQRQVGYSAGPADPETGKIPLFATGICQINACCFDDSVHIRRSMQGAAAAMALHEQQVHKTRRRTDNGRKRGAGGCTAVAARTSLTDRNAFAPVLKRTRTFTFSVP